MGVAGHRLRVTHVWYAAYGSNTDAARFQRYLDRCTIPATPVDDRPFVLDLPLYFARDATSWGPGGVAFVGPHRDDVPATLGRAWLLPIERVAEIGAMENRLDPTGAALDVEAVAGHGLVPTFGAGWYDAWAHCGELEGTPVVTITSSRPHEPNPPGPAYATVVARGLMATHDLGPDAVAAYLAPRTGLPASTLVAWIREGQGYPGAND